MDERNLEKALEIVSALISGEEVGRGVKKICHFMTVMRAAVKCMSLFIKY